MKNIRRWILKTFLPVTIWLGRLHLPFTIKRITGEDFLHLQSILTPGDVLCTKVLGAISNLMIPGEFKHVAMYVGDNMVVEAVGKGVKKTDLVSFLMTKDFVIARRPAFCDAKIAKVAATHAETLLGKPYDYFFEYSPAGNKAFYCSEIVWWSYDWAMGGKSPFVAKETLGEPTITPDDIAQSHKKWRTIWEK